MMVAAARTVGALVLAAGCASEGPSSTSSTQSEAVAFVEAFDGEPEGFQLGTNGGLTTAVKDGAYAVTLRNLGTAHRATLPTSGKAHGAMRIEADIDAGEGPIYGVGCWMAKDKSGYLGVVQVTDGTAAGGVAYESATGRWEPLEAADEGPTVRVSGLHTLRMDCTRRSDGGRITLSIDDEELAAVDVDKPPEAGGATLYVHYGGTPRGSPALVSFHEVRVSATQ